MFIWLCYTYLREKFYIDVSAQIKSPDTKHGKHLHDTFNSHFSSSVWWYKFPGQCWVSLYLYLGLNYGITFNLNIACKLILLPGECCKKYVWEEMWSNEGKESSSYNISQTVKHILFNFQKCKTHIIFRYSQVGEDHILSVAFMRH